MDNLSCVKRDRCPNNLVIPRTKRSPFVESKCFGFLQINNEWGYSLSRAFTFYVIHNCNSLLLHLLTAPSSLLSTFLITSYEDSLKSVAHRKVRSSTLRPEQFTSRSFHQRRIRNRSLSDEMMQSSGGIHRLQAMGHIQPAPALLIPTSSGLRRSTEHLVMSYPLNSW